MACDGLRKDLLKVISLKNEDKTSEAIRAAEIALEKYVFHSKQVDDA